jgi:hypothetical protein
LDDKDLLAAMASAYQGLHAVHKLVSLARHRSVTSPLRVHRNMRGNADISDSCAKRGMRAKPKDTVNRDELSVEECAKCGRDFLSVTRSEVCNRC